MRAGVRLAIDVGSVRIGIARSDPSGLVATPLRTLQRPPGVAEAQDGPDLDVVADLVRELEVVEVIVGLPLRLAGDEGPAAAAARGYAEAVARRVAPVTVRLVDERLSTVTATRSLRETGRRRQAQRSVVDQVAAVVILQSALDAERASGQAPGISVLPDPASTDMVEEP